MTWPGLSTYPFAELSNSINEGNQEFDPDFKRYVFHTQWFQCCKRPLSSQVESNRGNPELTKVMEHFANWATLSDD